MNFKSKELLKYFDNTLAILSFIFISTALYMTFVYSQEEVVMGPVQKILYFHVGSAVSCYLSLFIVFISSICFITFKNEKFISLQVAAVNVGLLFSSVVLVTGMIWGYSSWNTWWNWEPRLVSVLVLWLMLIGYLYLNNLVKFQSENSRNTTLTIFGILSSLQAPIVIFSIKLLDKTQQLHPEVVAKQGLKDNTYIYTLIFTNISLLIFSIWLIRIFYLIDKCSKNLESYKNKKIISLSSQTL